MRRGLQQPLQEGPGDPLLRRVLGQDHGCIGVDDNVGEEHALTEADWVRAIGRAAGWDGEVVVVPRDRLPVSLRWWGDAVLEQEWVIDTARFRVELEYSERVPRDGVLRHTVAWERANPPAEFPPTLFDYAAEDAALAGVYSLPITLQRDEAQFEAGELEQRARQVTRTDVGAALLRWDGLPTGARPPHDPPSGQR